MVGATANAVTVSLPDFARGPGQPVNLPANQNLGLPLTISTGVDVLSVSLTLHFNPALLVISGFTVNPALTGTSATFVLTSPGTATVSVVGTASLAQAEGTLILGHFAAQVPADAAYGGKQVLDIANLHVLAVNATQRPALDDDGFHVAAYFGDANGSRTYNAPDVTLLQRAISLLNTGFGAYPLVDPVLLADISLNGRLQANDAALLLRVISQVAVANVPPLPTLLTAVPPNQPLPKALTVEANAPASPSPTGIKGASDLVTALIALENRRQREIDSYFARGSN